MKEKLSEIHPNPNTKVFFEKAVAFIRKTGKPKICKLTRSHRGQAIKLEKGYILIEKQWKPKS
ncbi:MAG TPA: hypothetical protein ENF30_01835 [Candidatus Desulfofervidus auxilii]|uniref:Uncharacterized protein n=1 Tax=Desulfofervidus auxilii TaxID=1621989 RepID=A0A7V0IA69_DESA2|nr:hypothetical protein [Candidatus Desulfofervidus auxilii]